MMGVFVAVTFSGSFRRSKAPAVIDLIENAAGRPTAFTRYSPTGSRVLNDAITATAVLALGGPKPCGPTVPTTAVLVGANVSWNRKIGPLFSTTTEPPTLTSNGITSRRSVISVSPTVMLIAGARTTAGM